MPTPGKARLRSCPVPGCACLGAPSVTRSPAAPSGSPLGGAGRGGLEAQQSWPYGEPQGREGPGPTWSVSHSLSSGAPVPVSRATGSSLPFPSWGGVGPWAGLKNGVPTFPGGSSSSSIAGTHPSFPGGRWPRPGLGGARPAGVTQPRHMPGTSWARAGGGRAAGLRPQAPWQVVWGLRPSLAPLEPLLFGSRSLCPGRDRSCSRRGLLSAGVGTVWPWAVGGLGSHVAWPVMTCVRDRVGWL